LPLTQVMVIYHPLAPSLSKVSASLILAPSKIISAPVMVSLTIKCARM